MDDEGNNVLHCLCQNERTANQHDVAMLRLVLEVAAPHLLSACLEHDDRHTAIASHVLLERAAMREHDETQGRRRDVPSPEFGLQPATKHRTRLEHDELALESKPPCSQTTDAFNPALAISSLAQISRSLARSASDLLRALSHLLALDPMGCVFR